MQKINDSTSKKHIEYPEEPVGVAAIHYGQLEELLAECALLGGAPASSQGRPPIFSPIIRISTQHISRQTSTPRAFHFLRAIVTIRAWHAGDAFPHTGVWVWPIEEFETWHGQGEPGGDWTPHHAYLLLDAAVSELETLIAEMAGEPPRKGMYFVPPPFLDCGGHTSLIDLAGLRARVRAQLPPERAPRLLEKTALVRAHLAGEPHCSRHRLLALIWGEEGGASGRNLESNASELAMVLRLLGAAGELESQEERRAL